MRMEWPSFLMSFAALFFITDMVWWNLISPTFYAYAWIITLALLVGLSFAALKGFGLSAASLIIGLLALATVFALEYSGVRSSESAWWIGGLWFILSILSIGCFCSFIVVRGVMPLFDWCWTKIQPFARKVWVEYL